MRSPLLPRSYSYWQKNEEEKGQGVFPRPREDSLFMPSVGAGVVVQALTDVDLIAACYASE